MVGNLTQLILDGWIMGIVGELLSLSEVSRVSGVPAAWIRRQVSLDKLRYVLLSGVRHFTVEDVVERYRASSGEIVEVGQPVRKVEMIEPVEPVEVVEADTELNGMGVPIAPKRRRGRPTKEEAAARQSVPKGLWERRQSFKKKDAAKVLKQTMTAGESFDWIVRNLELTEQQFKDLVPSDAPDSEAWLILSSAFGDEDFRRLLQSKVLDRKMKRMENEQKRQFLDDGRAMDARLIELEGLLQGDDLLPKADK